MTLADLSAGDWLEYELDAQIDLARVSVDDAMRPVQLSLTERGFRLTALEATTIERIRIAQG